MAALAQPAAPATSAKLTTVLAELASVVPQESGAPRAAAEAAPAALDRLPPAVQQAIRLGTLRINAADQVQVYVLLRATDEGALTALTNAGAILEITDAPRRCVQARIPLSRLNTLAELPVVAFVRLPSYGYHRIGSFTSEGDDIVGAAAARSDFSIDGTGVRVGVISDGLKGVFESSCTTACTGAANGPISTGDLPAATGTRNSSGILTATVGGIVGRSFQANGDLEGLPLAGSSCGFAGAGAEGTALLEVVHDLAPGAKLSFANAATDLEFARAVNFLAASNDVVLDDVGFYGVPYDGTSAVSQNTAAALNNEAFPIRTYVTAVGNDADSHYDGLYADSGVDGAAMPGITNRGNLHLFQRTDDTTDVLGLGAAPYNVVQLPQNGEVSLILTWADPFGASANDYDLYLVSEGNNQVVAGSHDPQTGSQDPVEALDYRNTGPTGRFRIVIQNVQNAAQPRRLQLFSLEPNCASTGPELIAPPRRERLNFNTPTRSVAAQADAGGSPAGVIAVGAICSGASAIVGEPAASSDESCLDASFSTPEPFSSRGPTLDGRSKPDVYAIDGVSVTGAGSFPKPFFGTSAASPHVGAGAALVLQSMPCMLDRSTSTTDAETARTTLRGLLVGNGGLLDVHGAIQRTLPYWKGTSTSLTVDANTALGASLSATELGFVDPNACSITSLNWTGGCGTGPGATMTCPVGTSTVSASASNNQLTYSSPQELQITVTDFAIAATPAAISATGGTPTHFDVSVSPQGGTFSSAIVLTCNTGGLPPGTSCVFDPDTVTPGASTVHSVLTVTTQAGSTSSTGTPAPNRGVALRPSNVAAQAVTGPGIAVFPAVIDFGSQTVGTTAPARSVLVTNVGTDSLGITLITGAAEFPQVNDCGTSLAAGATCRISIAFSPAAAGARTGTVSITDSAPGSPHVVNLTGAGVAAPASGEPTPAGSYAITVVGTAGTMTHAAQVALSVQ